jgi:HlyD family secretion protein
LRGWSKWKNMALAACVLALAGALYASWGKIADYRGIGEPLLPSRDRSNPPHAVGALGRIEPQSEIINLGAGVSTPDRLESLFAARGDRVKKGQVLGYLGGYAEQVAQREMFVNQLEEAKLRLKTEVELDRSRIEAAKIHQKQIVEVSPLRISAQEASIASLDAKLANDKDILETQMQLFERGAASRRLREDQHALVLQDEANVASARARLEELNRQFQVDKIDAEIQIKLADAQLMRAEAEFPIASLQSQIAVAESRARRLTVYAPVDGRILNIRVKPGEDVGTGPLLTMGDTDRMRAVAEVYETDIAQVRVGQTATVTSRALSHPLSGTVERIGNMIFKNDVLNVDPAARADARVVEVWIDLDDGAPAEQLTNLTVDVVIDTSGAKTPVARSGSP